MKKHLAVGLVILAFLVVATPRQADAWSESERAWLRPIMQKYLNAAKPVFETQFGEDKAREYIQNIIQLYSDWYGIALDDPFAFVDNQALIDEYNRKLQDLADYLLSTGLSAAMVDEKVAQTMQYYEDLYNIRLAKPDIETSGEKLGMVWEYYNRDRDRTYVKTSIRRLGGIVTNQRPVSTLLGDDFQVQAGFLSGASIFDRKLMFRPPVGFPERRRPKKIAVVTKEVIQ
jgi:hypothetical protein